MNRKSMVIVAIAFVLTLLVVGSVLAEINQPEEVILANGIPQTSLAPWMFQNVETPNNVGAHTALAINPFSGGPFMSYATNGDLRLAYPVPDGTGNCGIDGNGKCQTIDGDASHGSTNVGLYSSIALWGTESNWKIGISYYDNTNKALKYATIPPIGRL